MMISINRVGDFITGTANGKSFSVPYNDEKWAKMQEFESKIAQCDTFEQVRNLLQDFEVLTTDTYKEFVEHKTPHIHVNKSTGQYHLMHNGILSKYPLPMAFVNRIIKAVETTNDVMPTIKMLVRFMRNPNFTVAKCARLANYLNQTYVDNKLKEELIKAGVSPQLALERATLWQTTMTTEGLLNTYKVSREIRHKFIRKEDEVVKTDRFDWEVDEITGLKIYKEPEFQEDRVFEPAVQGQGGDAFFCGDKEGHIIKVGQVHFLDSWDKVNTEDNRSCVMGLHVGNLNYIQGYQQSGTETHNVYIDPMDIGAITNDGSGAMRVLRYFVHSSFEGVNRGFYHSSKYAALTDKVFESMLDEAIAASNEALEQAKKEHAEKIEQINLTKTL
jgi:hypothetical protein